MKKLAVGALVGLMLCSTTAFAQDLEQKVRDLEKVVADQQKMISELVQRMDTREETGTSWAAGEESSSWFNKIEISGDLRYRHEWADDDRKDRDRHRQRIRARLDIEAEVNEDVDAKFQISTGGSATSGNQTLGGMWGQKGFYLARAEFDWHPSSVEGFHLRGGKIKRPFFTPQKSELQFDGDVNPEGVLVSYSGDLSEDVSLKAQAFGFWTVERSSDADSGLIGGEVNGKVKFDAFDGGAHVSGGIGLFQYLHPTDSGGTKIDTDMLDYQIFNGYVEFGAKIEEIPVAVYVDYVMNNDAEEGDSDDTGWAVGFKVGKAKKPGQFEAKYIYRHVEKYAVFSGFADSDFGGGGGNAEGHELGAKVKLADGWDLGLSLFFNNTQIASGEDEEDFFLGQLDLVFTF